MVDRYADMAIVIVLVVFFLAATERILEGLFRSFHSFFFLFSNTISRSNIANDCFTYFM